MAPKKEEKVSEPLSVVLKRAGKKALGGGLAGAMAMVAQVALLMWMRTVMNYQHANGLTTWEAITTLYAEGGLARLYQGWQAALLQAPISRFGDTAANALMLSLLANVAIPEAVKTFCSSWAAAGFRILITPIDAFKATLQVAGALTRLMAANSCSLFTPPQVVGALTVLMRRRNTPPNYEPNHTLEPWLRGRARASRTLG